MSIKLSKDSGINNPKKQLKPTFNTLKIKIKHLSIFLQNSSLSKFFNNKTTIFFIYIDNFKDIKNNTKAFKIVSISKKLFWII